MNANECHLRTVGVVQANLEMLEQRAFNCMLIY